MSQPVSQNPLGHVGVLAKYPPNIIPFGRKPLPTDINANIGDLGYDSSSNPPDFYQLVSLSLGVAIWRPITQQQESGFPITPYVVGPIGQAGFQTIQSAIDAANTDGGGQVWVQFGTYTENLTFYDKIQLSSPSEQSVTIIGTHTPPPSGTLNIDRLTFQSATNVFSSTAAGTTTIIAEDVTFSVTNGYSFNLPNWAGQVQCFDIGSSGTNDGFVNNTGGAVVAIFAAGVGNGSTNHMILSGPTIFGPAITIACPVNAGTGAKIQSANSQYSGTFTFTGDAQAQFYNDSFITSATPAITQSSTGTISLSTCSINSSANPCVAGAGAGVVTLSNISFLSNSAISGSLTISSPNTGTAGQVLTSNGSTAIPTYQANANGDVAGPGTSTDRAIATWNGTTGTALFDNPSITISSTTILAAASTSGQFFNYASNPGNSLAEATFFNTNSGTSAALALHLTTAGESDRMLAFSTGSGDPAQDWLLGMKNSDNSFRICQATVVGGLTTNPYLTITSTGIVQIPVRLDVGNAVNPSPEEVNIFYTNSGSTTYLVVGNLGTGAGSNSQIGATVDDATSDAFFGTNNTSAVVAWTFGQKGSDSNAFVLSANNTLGTNNVFRSDTTGNLTLGLNSSSIVSFNNSTLTTVGAAGGASALPLTPSGYILVNINGSPFEIPYYARA